MTRSFGRIQSKVVYYRQGTTTAIASPDDIARMGQSEDARKFQNALMLWDLQCEPDPEGWATLFRLEVRNNDVHRTIHDVCIRTVSLVRIDGSDSHERLPFTKPLLVITGTGRMPFSPPETCRNLVASDAVFFDFVWVHSHRKAGHSLQYGECIKDWPFMFRGTERWKLAHEAFLDPGKYKVTIEVQGKDVIPVRKQFVFWGDKTGQHCVDANDPSAQSTEPLEFAPIDLDTLPADMHPHQHRALETELRKPEYDGMTAEAAYRRIDRDKTMCGLSQVRFLTSAELEQTPLKKGEWPIVISDEEKSRFPSGIPGFPAAIRRSDFDIAWQAVRGKSKESCVPEYALRPRGIGVVRSFKGSIEDLKIACLKNLLLATVLLGALSACSLLRSQVAVFHRIPKDLSGTTYAIIPFKEQEGSLEHKAYEEAVRQELNAKGFRETTVDQAQVAVFLAYGIDTGREVVSSYPIIGQTGVSSSSTYGQFRATVHILAPRPTRPPTGLWERG